MAEVEANGVQLHYERHGEGEPLVLVHGSWGDADNWRLVAGGLAEHFEVLTYDRRGHSRSDRPDSQGSADEDGDDLAALLEELGMAPAHVVTNSFGGCIALRLAVRRPDVFRSLTCHEPPMFGILAGGDGELAEKISQDEAVMDKVCELIDEGEAEEAAKLFVEEVGFGPGAWENELPPSARETFVRNAPTFADERRDPNQLTIDEAGLRRIDLRVRLTDGSAGDPKFGRVADRLAELIPGAERWTFEGATHVPHMTMPDLWVEATAKAISRGSPARS